jgi:hypothetical protein
MKMKQPAQNVFLNDGCGYVVQTSPYQQHLRESVETSRVSVLCVASLPGVLFTIIPFHSAPPVPITRLSIKRIQIVRTYKPQEWVHVHVHVMDVLFPTQLWTFRKERGQLIFFDSYAMY